MWRFVFIVAMVTAVVTISTLVIADHFIHEYYATGAWLK